MNTQIALCFALPQSYQIKKGLNSYCFWYLQYGFRPFYHSVITKIPLYSVWSISRISLLYKNFFIFFSLLLILFARQRAVALRQRTPNMLIECLTSIQWCLPYTKYNLWPQLLSIAFFKKIWYNRNILKCCRCIFMCGRKVWYQRSYETDEPSAHFWGKLLL